jgi:hypothetical protein
MIMRILSTLLIGLLLAAGAFWVYFSVPEVKNITSDLLPQGKFRTLEVRHSAENIMEAHKRELLKDSDHVYLEPSLTFHPYLLLEVKYSKVTDKTNEGIILWSMVDGEMVINANTWEKTHGFTDCIMARASREDFKIINALSSNGGVMEKDNISKFLNIETDTLALWLEKCRIKSLIVQNGNNFRLHLQNPKLQVVPETKLDQWLVSKPSKNASRMPKRFRTSQIETTAKAAFGNDFAIRKTTEIFLPVYSIVVQNPDGSQMTTYWNALNGKKLSASFHIE